MTSKADAVTTFRTGAFKRRIAWVFTLQLVAVVITCVMGMYNVAPLAAVLAVIVIVLILGFMATQREWRPISALALALATWDESNGDSNLLSPDKLARGTDADIAQLHKGLYGLVSRIADYNQRERNFTRDASHELRSPLTVIKMSIDMLADEENLSDFGERSVRRIQRATREMETVVDALLILAREADTGVDSERFVVNDVLVHELDAARMLLAGRPIELELEEPARFALQGSRRVFFGTLLATDPQRLSADRARSRRDHGFAGSSDSEQPRRSESSWCHGTSGTGVRRRSAWFRVGHCAADQRSVLLAAGAADEARAGKRRAHPVPEASASGTRGSLNLRVLLRVASVRAAGRPFLSAANPRERRSHSRSSASPRQR